MKREFERVLDLAEIKNIPVGSDIRFTNGKEGIFFGVVDSIVKYRTIDDPTLEDAPQTTIKEYLPYVSNVIVTDDYYIHKWSGSVRRVFISDPKLTLFGSLLRLRQLGIDISNLTDMDTIKSNSKSFEFIHTDTKPIEF